MATDIEAFCRSCGKCQTNKTNMLKPQGFLHSLPIPDKLWQSVGMDFMGPLPRSLGNDYLLVIIDWLTSQVHLVPTTTWVTAKEVVWLFLKEVMRLHGVPELIVLDRNTKFMSTFWRELHRHMGTKLLMSTAFHPQMDGATEWANCSIGQILRMIINDHQKELGRQMPNGRVCAKQQCQRNNQIRSIQAESGIHATAQDANLIWHHIQGCQTIHITSEVGPNGSPWRDYHESHSADISCQ